MLKKCIPLLAVFVVACQSTTAPTNYIPQAQVPGSYSKKAPDAEQAKMTASIADNFQAKQIAQLKFVNQEEKRLRSALVGTGVDVIREDDAIRLILPGDKTFAVSGTTVAPAFHPVLDKIARLLAQTQYGMIKIAGYSSNTGPRRLNEKISSQRARNIATYFTRHKISNQRLFTVGFGDLNPIASNDTEQGRAKNRRVEITVKPDVLKVVPIGTEG